MYKKSGESFLFAVFVFMLSVIRTKVLNVEYQFYQIIHLPL